MLRRLTDPSVIVAPIHMCNEISDDTTRKMIEPLLENTTQIFLFVE